MVNRYGYNWEYLTSVAGTPDVDGNPTTPTDTWTSFECDVQTGSEKFITNDVGDNISVTYSIFTKVVTNLVRGGKVRDENLKEYTVLQAHNYTLNYEIWV